jgi:hypothetical protein
MIKRFYATKDNTITNAFEENLVTRGTGSNMGASDILEVFSIYGQANSSSAELSRVLIEFPIDEISTARTAGNIPASGSVSFFLKMFNAPHSQTVPSDFTMTVSAVSQAWEEGYGIDMDFYEDLTKDKVGSNWINAKERASATATIVASTPGSLLNAATFTLTNAAGTTTTYRINGGGSGTGTNDYQTQPGGAAGSTIEVYFRLASTVAHVAEAIKKAINATTDADMTATDNGTNVTITQTTKGTAGNKTNTDNSSGLTSVGNFSGATGQWTSAGGDYHASPTFTQTFETGLEDLKIDVSELVEQWIKKEAGGGKENYGFGVKLTDASETTTRSFFTKKFFGRDSEFHYQKPVLEARWDSSRKDDRGYFYASSSLVSANENLNNLYLYNSVRGRLRDYPIAPTSASIRLTSTAGPGSNVAVASVSKIATGVYKARIAVNTTASTVHDIWYSGSVGYHTGSISVKSFESFGYNPEDTYVLSMPSLRKEYRKKQTHRLNLYVRQKNWSPNIHTQAVRSSIPSLIIPSASFQLRRCIDDFIVVPYGTGSNNHTGLSYDVSGNYFDLDTTYLETGYLYDVQYSFYDEENGWEEQPYRFKFRVVD